MAAATEGKWRVIGHDWAVQFLRRALEGDNLSHAYLIVGQPQLGKRTLALEFARAVNCEGERRPCGTCRACTLALAGRHPDIVTVRGEGVRSTILIDQVRDLCRQASLAPVEGRRRVYVICNAELANEHAANAFLKTLEEPRRHVIFVLTATAEELVMPTIVSRCQVLFLHSLSREVIQRGLMEHWEVPEERARLLAHLSGGRMGRALSLLENEKLLARRTRALDQLRELLAGGWMERFAAAQEASKRSDELLEHLEVWLSWWRDLLLLQQGLADRIVNLDRATELRQMEPAFTPGQARGAVEAIQTCAYHIQKNVGARLAMEWLMLHLPTAGRLPLEG